MMRPDALQRFAYIFAMPHTFQQFQVSFWVCFGSCRMLKIECCVCCNSDRPIDAGSSSTSSVLCEPCRKKYIAVGANNANGARFVACGKPSVDGFVLEKVWRLASSGDERKLTEVPTGSRPELFRDGKPLAKENPACGDEPIGTLESFLTAAPSHTATPAPGSTAAAAPGSTAAAAPGSTAAAPGLAAAAPGSTVAAPGSAAAAPGLTAAAPGSAAAAPATTASGMPKAPAAAPSKDTKIASKEKTPSKSAATETTPASKQKQQEQQQQQQKHSDRK
mmetsp:Transcript_39283/g.93039  ORF Transcript_39283/g.93039 Transcript_39283/m.93039 type:complete len:277 (+) Transcript_39283:247-1077(+)